MTLTNEDIQTAVARYEREYDRYAKLAEVVYERCLRIVGSTGVRATVQRRTKQPQSFRKKLIRIQRQEDYDPRFTTVDDVFANMSDLAAVRIASYLESDRQVLAAEVAHEFALCGSTPTHPNPDSKDKSGRAQHYRAIHCQVSLKTEDIEGPNANLAGASCEIQICSMLAHVWNEIEHDLGYKPNLGELSERELDCLDALGQLVRAGDVVIKTLLDANEERVKTSETRFGNHHDFITRMHRHFPTASRFHVHADQLFDVLIHLGLDSPGKIREKLLGEGDEYVDKAWEMIVELDEFIRNQQDNVVVAELDTSDQLAVLLFEQERQALFEHYPSGRGMGRPMRLVSLAKRFEAMRQQQP